MRRVPTAFFLGDAAFLADAKFRALARLLPDADAFNSAVGTYFIALAAARRNGLPQLDVAAETGSTYVADLVAVGLLTDDGFPESAFREWAPSRPKYQSDLRPAPSATDAPSVTSATDTPQTPSRTPSTPLPSISTPPTGGGVGEGLAHLNSAVEASWLEATGRTVLGSGAFAAEYLDDACRRHPAYEVAAAIVRARKTFDHVPAPQPLTVAVRAILDPLPSGKDTAAAEREQEATAASRRRVEATLRRNHDVGAHEAEPHPRCPACEPIGVPA